MSVHRDGDPPDTAVFRDGRGEAAQQAQGWRLYRLVARDRGTACSPVTR